MRRLVFLGLVSSLVLLTFLIHLFSTLLGLLVEDGSADAILLTELPRHTAPKDAPMRFEPSQPQLIPKIIHQTYKNESIPERWKEPWQQCQDIMKADYEFKFWTDITAREFIADKFSWFLDTYDAYPHNIQRADVIRYFVLAHYGGVYLDLDNGCNRRLDPLLTYPAWVHRTTPTGISNDAFGSTPNHPFILYVIHSLKTYARNWGTPYVTVMYSTGPLFLSVLWKQYMASGKNVGDGIDGGRVRVMMEEEYQRFPWSFFTQFVGSSWHEGDARAIVWVGDNIGQVIAGGVVSALTLMGVLWWLFSVVRRRSWLKGQSKHHYDRLPKHEA